MPIISIPWCQTSFWDMSAHPWVPTIAIPEHKSPLSPGVTSSLASSLSLPATSLSSLNNSQPIPGTTRSWGSHSHGNRKTCGTEQGLCPSLPGITSGAAFPPCPASPCSPTGKEKSELLSKE